MVHTLALCTSVSVSSQFCPQSQFSDAGNSTTQKYRSNQTDYQRPTYVTQTQGQLSLRHMLLPLQQIPLCNSISHCSLLCGTGMLSMKIKAACVCAAPLPIICLPIALVSAQPQSDRTGLAYSIYSSVGLLSHLSLFWSSIIPLMQLPKLLIFPSNIMLLKQTAYSN